MTELRRPSDIFKSNGSCFSLVKQIYFMTMILHPISGEAKSGTNYYKEVPLSPLLTHEALTIWTLTWMPHTYILAYMITTTSTVLTNTYIHMYIYIYVYIYIHTHVHLHTHTYTSICVCVTQKACTSLTMMLLSSSGSLLLLKHFQKQCPVHLHMGKQVIT